MVGGDTLDSFCVQGNTFTASLGNGSFIDVNNALNSFILENYLYNLQCSFLRTDTSVNTQTWIRDNVATNIQATSTFIELEIVLNNLIIFEGNNLTNFYLRSSPVACRGINLLSIDV